MGTVTIRNLDDDVIKEIGVQAAENGVSREEELRRIIIRAARVRSGDALLGICAGRLPPGHGLGAELLLEEPFYLVGNDQDEGVPADQRPFEQGHRRKILTMDLDNPSNRYLRDIVTTYPTSKEAEEAKKLLPKEDRLQAEEGRSSAAVLDRHVHRESQLR